jgi:hypothetical protein
MTSKHGSDASKRLQRLSFMPPPCLHLCLHHASASNQCTTHGITTNGHDVGEQLAAWDRQQMQEAA